MLAIYVFIIKVFPLPVALVQTVWISSSIGVSFIVQEKDTSEHYFISTLIKEHRQREFSAWWDEDKHSYGFGELEQKVYRALLEKNKATADLLAENINLSLNDIEDALTVLAGTGVIQQLDYETYKIGSQLFSQWVMDEKYNSQCQQL